MAALVALLVAVMDAVDNGVTRSKLVDVTVAPFMTGISLLGKPWTIASTVDSAVADVVDVAVAEAAGVVDVDVDVPGAGLGTLSLPVEQPDRTTMAATATAA